MAKYHYCPNCKLSISDLVKAAVWEELHRRAQKAGKAGGPARAKALSATRRSEIARMGAYALHAKKHR